MVQRLKQTFGDPSPEEQSARHVKDLNTTWFGVLKEANQGLSLHYNTRLVDIMQDSRSGEYEDRFPQLVSFVGQTGMCFQLYQAVLHSYLKVKDLRYYFLVIRGW